MADFLSKQGFEPRHWYANWKEIEKNAWLQFKNPSRGDPTSENIMTCDVFLRDAPPNVSANEFVPKDEKAFKKAIEEKLKPYAIDLLQKSGIAFEIVQETNE